MKHIRNFSILFVGLLCVSIIFFRNELAYYMPIFRNSKLNWLMFLFTFWILVVWVFSFAGLFLSFTFSSMKKKLDLQALKFIYRQKFIAILCAITFISDIVSFIVYGDDYNCSIVGEHMQRGPYLIDKHGNVIVEGESGAVFYYCRGNDGKHYFLMSFYDNNDHCRHLSLYDSEGCKYKEIKYEWTSSKEEAEEEYYEEADIENLVMETFDLSKVEGFLDKEYIRYMETVFNNSRQNSSSGEPISKPKKSNETADDGPKPHTETRWVEKSYPCQSCINNPRFCQYCGGFGYSRYNPDDVCNICHGTKICTICGGSGEYKQNEQEYYTVYY